MPHEYGIGTCKVECQCLSTTCFVHLRTTLLNNAIHQLAQKDQLHMVILNGKFETHNYITHHLRLEILVVLIRCHSM